ncbi:MAG: Gfo/Idh/MocA family oxidoreductase [Chloroflexota bacterium]
MTTVALIGCAHIHTPGFAKRLSERDDITVKSVWDHSDELARKYAGQLNASVAELDTVWADSEIKAVVICSETDRHQPLVEAAAQAGKHMFVEKPLGMGAADAYAMADRIQSAGVLFQTGYFQRGHPIHLFVKEHIEKGSFGQITRLRHSNCHAGSLRDIFTPDYLWMTDMAQAGVGAFGDLGTHSLDIMLWLLGDVETVTATIDVGPDNYNGCDEYGEGLLKYKNGAIGSLAAGWVDIAHPVNLIISGTEGHAHADNGKLYFKSNHVEGATGEEPWTDLPEAWPHAFELFLEAVDGKEDLPLVQPYEAAMRSDVMEALYKAATQGKWVKPKR